MEHKKPKIAHIITKMDWEGSPDILRIIFEQTSDIYDATLITGETKNLTETVKLFFKKNQQRIIILPNLRKGINPFWDICALLQIIKIIKKQQFDIVHTHASKAGFLGRIAAKLCNVKKIIHMPHGHIFYNSFPGFIADFFISLERFISFFTNTFVTLTCLEKNDLLSYHIAPSKKIVVIPSGIEINTLPDLSSFQRDKKRSQLNIGKEEIAIGMISPLEEIKKPQHFVFAAQLIKNKNIKFIVVGDGPLRENLQNIAKISGLNMDFLGYRQDIPEIIASLDNHHLMKRLAEQF